MVEDLEELGSRLELDGGDIASIRRRKRREYLLAPLVGLALTILSTMAGFLIGKNDPIFDKIQTYPFAGAMLLSISTGKMNKKLWITVGTITLVTSVIGFVAAHEFAQPHEYGAAIEYGVYTRR